MDNNVKLKVEEIKQRGFNLDIGSIFNRAWEIFSGIAIYAILALIIYCIVAVGMSFVAKLIYGYTRETSSVS